VFSGLYVDWKDEKKDTTDGTTGKQESWNEQDYFYMFKEMQNT
jgi:hypothetical protein